MFCLLTLPAVVRGCALLSAGFSRSMLTGVAEMRQRITVLTEQKATYAEYLATFERSEPGDELEQAEPAYGGGV